MKNLILTLTLGTLLAGCQKPTVQTAEAEPAPAAPAAPVAAPAPAEAKPAAAQAAAVRQEIITRAPSGRMFLARTITQTTENGILRFAAGTEIEVIEVSEAGQVKGKVGADLLTVTKEDVTVEWKSAAPQTARVAPAASAPPPAARPKVVDQPAATLQPQAVTAADQQRQAESRIRVRELEAALAATQQRRNAVNSELQQALANYRERRIVQTASGATYYRQQATRASSGGPPDSPENKARQRQIAEFDRQISAIQTEIAKHQQLASGQ